MKPVSYDLTRREREALVSDCAAASEAAAIGLARCDERLLRAAPVLAEGVLQRGHAFEAQALIGLGGGLCPLEDLVLHDAGMDVRSPTREIARAAAMLDERALLEARRLLLYSNLSVTEIAYSVGFDDPAYFSRFFTRHVGQPPRAYRAGRGQDVSG